MLSLRAATMESAAPAPVAAAVPAAAAQDASHDEHHGPCFDEQQPHTNTSSPHPINADKQEAPLSTPRTVSFAEMVHSRHSTRRFLSTRVVPRTFLLDALTLAQRAPSNSNIQPWHLDIVEGASRERLCAALLEAAHTRPREVAPLPPSFRTKRFELGTLVYGAMGIARGDIDGRAAAVLQNFSGFGAPTIGIVSIHRDLGPVDIVSVGMWLQTLILALSQRGLQTCVQASLGSYPDVVSRELRLPEERRVLCGLAIGYEDQLFSANHIHTPRDDVAQHVHFVEDDDREHTLGTSEIRQQCIATASSRSEDPIITKRERPC